ncbi:hypothetical protein BDB01DRAFT_833808 [Pilobolus umbonatus]|nr:hypothetical protein BDB01DRAFT_833804 [Pilobolus umbonatus]KAI8988756.1 hypothetical protein BDB01DRAFT_833808 [Pilobolus umbonatus]
MMLIKIEFVVELEESSEEDEHQEILSLNTSTTGVTSTDSVSVDSHYRETTREKMMNIVKDILQTLYKNISMYKTEQEIAIKELQDVNSSIKNSMVNVDMLLPPSTNTNRKGRKSKKGVKESTKRLEILREIFEKRQVADVKKKEKDEKVKVETEKKKRFLENEERHVALQLKKRKLMLVVQGADGKLVGTTASKPLKPDVKRENNPADFDILDSFSSQKKDKVFEYVENRIRKFISTIHSVGGDGNCGFRAVSFEIYKDQSRWERVKDDMLKTYMQYKDTLYKSTSESDSILRFKEEKMIRRLQSKVSPCLHDTDLWFSSFVCPQIVADTYQRPVYLYCYTENYVHKTGATNKIYESQIFMPLIHMDLSSLQNPIPLLLANSHFYFIEFSRTNTGRLKKLPDIHVINMDHSRLRSSYGSICNSVDYSELISHLCIRK